jgi:hypothetical protein
MQSVEIKAIDNNDFDIWLPLWKGYQRFYELDISESVSSRPGHTSWTQSSRCLRACHGGRTSIGAGAFNPAFQEYFRTHKPRFLALWGKNAPFFLSSGAETFKHDNPDADVRFLDTGRFALETRAKEIGDAIGDFLIR